MLIFWTITAAFAWRHEGFLWPLEGKAVTWCAEIGEDAPLPAEEFLSAAERGWEIWIEAAPGAGISSHYLGECAGEGAAAEVAFRWGAVAPSLGGCEGEAGWEAGVGSSVRCDQSYAHATCYDALLPDEGEWITLEMLEAGGCEDEFVLDTLLLHEIGHILGLGHSCEDGETCTDLLAQEAVMFWAQAPCEHRAPNEDDSEGLLALYGEDCSEESGNAEGAEVHPQEASGEGEASGCNSGGVPELGGAWIGALALLGRLRRK